MIEPETGDLSPMAMTAVTGVALLGGSKFLNLTSNGDSTVDQVANPMGFIGKALLAVGLIGALFPMAANWLGNVGTDNGRGANVGPEQNLNDVASGKGTPSQSATLDRLPNMDDLRYDENGEIYLPQADQLQLSDKISVGDNVDAVEAPAAGECQVIVSVHQSKC